MCKDHKKMWFLNPLMDSAAEKDKNLDLIEPNRYISLELIVK